MTARRVEKLTQAERLNGWPEMIPRIAARGVKALGRRYEAAVGRQLGPQAVRGIWWSYRDANGPGLCQTDFLINGEYWAVILECKHTWTADGMHQLQDLYLPVVGMALDKKVMGVQVCKHLTPNHVGSVYNTLEEAVREARTGDRLEHNRFNNPTRLVTLHWRGIGPMLHTSTKEYA